jgi:alpha-glucosidase
VLPDSEIGRLAVFGRRRGQLWFLAILNAPEEQKTIEVPLTFLRRARSQAMLVKDNMNDPAAVEIENKVVSSKESLSITLRPGGGFIARFS